MKNSWAYLATAAICGLCILFAAYTGVSLFSQGARAAGPTVTYHYDVVEKPSDAPAVPAASSEPVIETPMVRWLPENGKVLFVGNSLVQGLESVNGYENASFLCKKGLSLSGLARMVDADTGDGFDLAVIEMGSNEMGIWSEEDFVSAYSGILDLIQCPVICLSVPPVCEAKSNYGSRVSSANAAETGAWIEGLCENRDDAIYLDCSLFFGQDLDPMMTGDGLHLTGKAYGDWYVWIMDNLTADRPVE